MMIRSQSKRYLVNMENVQQIYVEGVNIMACFVDGNDDGCLCLGVYAAEKALKVLDMIQNKYLSYTKVNGGMTATANFYIQPNMWNMPKVFQMPADEEVEV